METAALVIQTLLERRLTMLYDFIVALVDVTLNAIGFAGLLLLAIIVVVAIPTIKLWLDGLR